MTVRFDDAAQRTTSLAASVVQQTGLRCTVIRDLRGVLRLVVDDRARALPTEDVEAWETSLREAAGAFAPPDGAVLLASMFGDPDAVLAGALEVLPGVAWLERTLLGWDWSPESVPPFVQSPARLVFYGIKGGVGRSTAAAVTAIELARSGRRVLVVDMDLESPGLGEMLAPDGGPRAGAVDWLVEDLVGNADDALVRDMLHRVSVPDALSGELWVVPAAALAATGAPDTYLPKLARVYQGVSREGVTRSFAARVREMVEALEREVRPDVTIVDSRAGMHDIAAATMVGLGGRCLLFAMNSAQTWSGYRRLFEAWAARASALRELRESVTVVAALVPEAGDRAYVEGLRGRAYDLFAEYLYDQQRDATDDVFNHEMLSEDAPHDPLEIHWNRRLLEFDPTAAAWPAEVRAAYERFLAGLRRRKLIP